MFVTRKNSSRSNTSPLPRPQIRFYSEEVKASPGKPAVIRTWLVQIAARYKKSIGSLHYIFVTDEHLYRINRDFLNHDTLTDIITFDYSGDEKKGTVSGEIYISLERVAENAKKFGVAQKQELHRVMAHGLLHLCGLRDKTLAEKKRMRVEEEKSLALLLK